jgi:hypothetical protein
MRGIWFSIIFICLQNISAQPILATSYGECNFYVTDGVLSKDKVSCQQVEFGRFLLDFRKKEIKALSTDVFKGLSRYISNIDLSDNEITTISGGALQDLSMYSGIVNISNNKLTYIEADTFEGSNVVEWDLSKNQIVEIQSRAFQGLTASRVTIILQNNNLTTLPAGIFKGLGKSYINVDVSNNFISSVQAGFCEDARILSLNIANNSISTLEKNAFYGCWPLQQLYLAENLISVLPSTIFQGLWNISELTLHNNSITQLPSNVFENLYKLSFLSLGGNTLQCLPFSTVGIYVSAFKKGQELNLPICQDDDEKATEIPEKIKPKFIQVDAQRFAYQKCIETRSWEMIANYYKNFRDHFSSGSLGDLSDDVFFSWACFRGHPCLSELGALSPTDAMCYVYNEIDGTWFPWGIKSEIGNQCVLGV